jgi:pimeloyl-ACP methyl ester carboxylesterase
MTTVSKVIDRHHMMSAMTRHRALLALLLPALLVFVDAWAQSPAVSRRGELNGADYLIEVPANWKGGLVVFAHGIQYGAGKGAAAAPPIAAHIVGEGHAIVASGYRARGYIPHLAIEDSLAVRELFLKGIGKPRWSIIYGQSMGGHIVVGSLELHPGVYQGGLAECGLVDGASIVDYLLAYTAAAELISGVPLLDAPDRETFQRRLNEQVVPVLGMPGAYTAKGKQFDSVVKYLMGADQKGNELPLRMQGMQRRYLMNMVWRDPDVEKETLPGARAGDTRHIRYRIDSGLGLSEDEINKRVRRFSPAKDGRGANPVFAERTGRITVPLLTLHETGDVWVPLVFEQLYRRRTIAAGTGHLLVQRVMRGGGHCGFSGEMREQAFDDLVAWIERGVKPQGEDVIAPDLSRVGMKWTPTLHPDDPLFRRP